MAVYQTSEAAASDLSEIFEYTVERWGWAQAGTYLLQLEDSFTDLADMPGKGVSRPELSPGLRYWSLH